MFDQPNAPAAEAMHLPAVAGDGGRRLAWPAAAAVVIGASFGLWIVIGMIASRLGLF